MGEYFGGAKLGTMDDFRYVRRDELTAVFAESGNYDLRSYLEDEMTLYRFPWLDEDGQTYQAGNGRDMFRTMVISGVDVDAPDHSHIWKGVGANGGGSYNVNVAIPCPASPEFHKSGLQHSPLCGRPIAIVGERYDKKGNGRTIFSCAYCGSYFSGGIDDIVKIQESLLDDAAYYERRDSESTAKWYRAIAARLMAKKE